MAAMSDWKGDAFLLVNSYTTYETRLEPLIRIDEAIKDFWDTFHTLRIQPVVRWNLTREQLDQELKLWEVKPTTKYVVFYFIGHGGDGDVLFMEDGGTVTTKEIVETFARLPKEVYKFFFIDACRGTRAGKNEPYCLTLESSLLARSTLPYQVAHTGDTYGILKTWRHVGIWSKNLLPLLRANTESLHKTLLIVDAFVKQRTQYTNSSVPDVYWAKEVEASGGNFQSSSPRPTDEFLHLSETMKHYRAKMGIRSSDPTLDAPNGSSSKSTVALKIPSEATDELLVSGQKSHPTREDTQAGPLLTTDRQTSPSLVITHPADVIEALGNQVDPRWNHFGNCLRFDSTLMNIIEKDNRGKSADCMLALVTRWLREDDGTGKLPRTWETVVKAVKDSSADHARLARELKKNLE